MRRSSLISAIGVVAVVVVLGLSGQSLGRPLQADATTLCKLKGIRYVGTTSQSKKVCFTLGSSGKRISEYAYGFRDNCGATGTSRTASRKGIPVAANGSFSTGEGTPAFFNGRLYGTKASGKLGAVTQTSTSAGVVPCNTGVVRWTARRTAAG